MKESTKQVILSIAIFLVILILLILSINLISNEMSSAYKECNNQSDDYVVKDVHWGNITCGELKAVNTSESIT